MVLPPEPRKYWAELADEHKKAPEHLAWQYMPDPFAARKLVEERQALAAEKKKQQEHQAYEGEDLEGIEKAGYSARDVKVASWEYEKAPEVRMSAGLRDMVENAIKQVNLVTEDFLKLATKLRTRRFHCFPRDSRKMMKLARRLIALPFELTFRHSASRTILSTKPSNSSSHHLLTHPISNLCLLNHL
jgi:hypothetical protein